jgi:hypothetical protein
MMAINKFNLFAGLGCGLVSVLDALHQNWGWFAVGFVLASVNLFLAFIPERR